jgi:hypothetical protein
MYVDNIWGNWSMSVCVINQDSRHATGPFVTMKRKELKFYSKQNLLSLFMFSVLL